MPPLMGLDRHGIRQQVNFGLRTTKSESELARASLKYKSKN